MQKLKLTMVGNGMAGVRTLEELLKLVPDLYDITVFGAEPHPNYNRILLSPVLAGEMTLDDIVLNDLDWYARHGIQLHVGKRVERIDRRACKVIAADGKLIVLSERGELIIVRAMPNRYVELARANVLIGTCYAHPVLANGRILCRNRDGELVCLDVRKKADTG